jgi:hypothetical protein
VVGRLIQGGLGEDSRLKAGLQPRSVIRSSAQSRPDRVHVPGPGSGCDNRSENVTFSCLSTDGWGERGCRLLRGASAANHSVPSFSGGNNKCPDCLGLVGFLKKPDVAKNDNRDGCCMELADDSPPQRLLW